MKANAKPSRRIALSICDTHSHGPLCYLEMGRADAPCVVFLHGFGADLLTWQYCLAPLAAQYRLIALDLPGHGRSSVDVGEATLGFMTGWLAEALDELGVFEAHFVGHSMGAKIALGLALVHPERVQSLGLIAPAGLGGDFHHATLDEFLSDTAQAPVLAAHLLGPKSLTLIPALAGSLTDACADPERSAALKRLLGQAKTYGLALSPEGFDWSKVRVPVMILWGDCDKLIPMPGAHRLPQHSSLHIVEGVGHLPHIEAPGRVVAALKDFLP